MHETKNPWTVLSHSQVYENDWIRVRHHDVLNPGGRPGVYGTVHFKHHALGIVPIDAHGNVVLVGQYRFPLEAYSWEIPEGGGSHSVPLVESAQRELQEECGIVAAQWREILQLDLSNSVSDERATVFLAWDLSETEAQPEESEKLEIARIPFWTAVNRAERGEIRDAISVAALLRTALMASQEELPKEISKLLTTGNQAG
jgi:8-oxo-dGTP pyrophosphatase MutT (NUDIX family)